MRLQKINGIYFRLLMFKASPLTCIALNVSKQETGMESVAPYGVYILIKGYVSSIVFCNRCIHVSSDCYRQYEQRGRHKMLVSMKG